MELFSKYEALLGHTETIRTWGEVQKVQGLLIESRGPVCTIGEKVTLELPDGATGWAEVVGITEKAVQLMALTPLDGLVKGSPVYAKGKPLEVLVGPELLGRILNGVGQPLDGKSLNFYSATRSIFHPAAGVLERKLISERLDTGVKAMDGFLTLGKGQRLGIFAGAGVGKSTLLSMIARNTKADFNVIALIGERRREVQEFIERELGPEGMARSVVIVATADDPPLARVRALYTATTIAEWFRDEGKDVMLIVDSVTRCAMAQREIGASLGEIPVSRGYSPSVYTMLPRIMERAGATPVGSITGLYNVLVEGDDMDEPVSDIIKGVLDGHVVLSRKLAERNHYPAIDIPASISRSMVYVAPEDHLAAARQVREWMAAYRDVEDLIQIGAYVRGSNPLVDQAITRMPDVNGFLRQGIREVCVGDETRERLMQIAGGRGRSEGLLRAPKARPSVLGG